MTYAPDKTAFGISVGDRIQHKREPGWAGTVIAIDADCYLAETYGVTTCEVQWDDMPAGETDVQWTNRIEALS